MMLDMTLMETDHFNVSDVIAMVNIILGDRSYSSMMMH